MTGNHAVQPVSSPINLTGRLGAPITVSPVEEVVVVPELDTVSQVSSEPSRLEAVVASHPYAKHVETQERNRHLDKQVRQLGSEKPLCPLDAQAASG